MDFWTSLYRHTNAHIHRCLDWHCGMCFAHADASVSWCHDKMRTDGNSQQVEVVTHKLIWELCSINTGLISSDDLSQKWLSFSALTQMYFIWSYSVCGLCVDACVCLCTSVSVIGFYLHCNCLGSSSMLLWQYVKHNKTLGLNVLTSDLDIWIYIFFHIQVLWHIFFFLYGNKKHFHMSELANYMAHISYQSCSFL